MKKLPPSGKETFEPRLVSMRFSNGKNPLQLVSTIDAEIISDSIVECWVPHLMSDKHLIADFEFEGDNISIGGQEAESGITAIDYRRPTELTVFSEGASRRYTVYVHAFTGLPVVWIETEGRKEINSKEEYLHASFRLAEDVQTRAAGDFIEAEVNIKGRGNSTWAYMPKKSYRLKFDKKVSLIDNPADRSWVLLANYADKSMVRTSAAFYMGRISNLEYTPISHFVELILNGQYNGTYLLCDKLKIAKHRVNVGDDGYLLEVDAKTASEDVTITASHIYQPINIKDPYIDKTSEAYLYVSDFVAKADSVLFSDYFQSPDSGWRKYLDMESFVDWYLINEITKNNDAVFHSSCYMNLKRGGKLKMGPLWDFDISIGNIDYNGNYIPEGLWIKQVPWYARLFEDPEFVAKVKERFRYFYSMREEIIQEINDKAEYLRYSVEENENRWHTFYTYTWPNYDITGNYMNEVQHMKDWLNTRFEWLNAEFDQM